MTIDELAQEIRRVDGSNSLGAGALAEKLMPFIAARALRASSGREMVEVKALRGILDDDDADVFEKLRDIRALATRPRDEGEG